MGWQERDYASADGYARATGRRPSIIPRSWKVSTILLVINVGLFLIAPPVKGGLFESLIMDAELVLRGQIWRILTPCFLHWDMNHLLFNMIGLYCFGAALEHNWGRRRFLAVYLIGGVLANVIYVLLYMLGWSAAAGLAAGASGCIYAILGACALLMPHIRVLVFFVLPMNIRTFLALFAAWGIYNVFRQGSNAGGDAVHLAGLAFGLGYAYLYGRSSGASAGIRRTVVKVITTKRPASPWRRKMEDDDQMNNEVDQVLAKINDHGVGSLTAREKRLLAEASQRQRARDEELGRTDRL
ncbi:MAG: rhomboid family intramembrane serine protease [Planctomycetota bacterium]|nr:rhomboid family intramembrane serine protease [Planctomycetota bacterium]